VAEALAELERAAGRTYYDAAGDARDRDRYYQGLGERLAPAELFRALHELLERTHRPRLAYKPSRELYPWVDLQPERDLRSIYSGQRFSARALIEEDFRIEQERAARLERFMLTEAAADPVRLSEHLALLEAQSPYNCEHVVPQSWFDYREPMKGDLHHLFACEVGCNSFRGNTPYFDFRTAREAIRQGCGRRETNRFEPTAGKGEVARATLYFLMRYPGEVERTATKYTEDRLPILLGWHQEFPVTEHERHRNQTIFARQGNRNPLIDFPDWAERIAFRGGLG
jgi:endonuclease I